MEIDQEFKELCEEYAAQLPTKLTAISSDWYSLKEHNDQALLKELIRKVHSLVGSGATFGFTALSKTAAQLEKILRQHQIQTMDLEPKLEHIEHLITTLENIAQQPPDNDFNADLPQHYYYNRSNETS